MSSNTFIIQGKNIVVFVNGQPTTVTESHLNYNRLLEALKAQDWAAVPGLISVRKALSTFGKGRVSIIGDEVWFDGQPIHNALSIRMVNAFRDGFPIDHFALFMENLDANPSYRARNELIGFLDACSLPITDDGCFLAYKKVRSDFTDVHTGTFDNSPGTVVQMPRRDVNEDPNQTCSAGLHACSYSYLRSFSGERVVVVKINPRDVVSVPVDYNNAKLRCCEYLVVNEIVLEDAQVGDSLSQGPAVRTGFVRPAPFKKSYRVEDVLREMDSNDFEALCEELDVDPGTYYSDYHEEWNMNELIDDVRISLIRKAIDKLNLV